MESIEKPDMIQQQSAESLSLHPWEHDEILLLLYLFLFYLDFQKQRKQPLLEKNGSKLIVVS